MINNIFEGKNHIALLGGTFNPIHKGHIYMADCVLKLCHEVEEIYILPNNNTAYKDNTLIASPEHRINMIKLAIENKDNISICDLDIKRGGITYTIDTLHDIRNLNKNIIIDFIIGADSLLSFHKWYCYQDILSLCNLIVINRESDKETLIKEINRLKLLNCETKFKLLDVPEYKASSSEIRAKIHDGDYNIEVLNDNIINYIRANELYR